MTEMIELKKEVVLEKSAEILERHLGVEKSQVICGTPFLELHSDFDSLTFTEVQLMLEDEYKFEFDRDAMQKGGKLPANALELAVLVVEHEKRYRQVQAAKAAAKAAQKSAAGAQ